jgi:hypothetical protein
MAEPSHNKGNIAIIEIKTSKRRVRRIKRRCQRRANRCEVKRELADKMILWGLAT